MKETLIILLVFSLYSCHRFRESDTLIITNDILIKNELNDLEKLASVNPLRALPWRGLAERIYDPYNSIKCKYLRDHLIDDSLYNSIVKQIIGIINGISYNKVSQKIECHYLKGHSFQVIQLQYLTLYCMKSVKEVIYRNDYTSNLCCVESIKKGNRIELNINILDTTFRPKVMIGKLQNNKNAFVDSFILAQNSGLSTCYIPCNKVGKVDFVEGLCILPMINGDCDTIKFRSKLR